MSFGEKAFNVIMRIVFVFAFGAFLWASLHHVATFFYNFEPVGSDWTGSYALAISIDGTALMLTIGMMFFSKNKPLTIKIFVWGFIIALTGFSWIVNWEYASRYQSTNLTSDSFWLQLNPILASSFAFLNLAYSIVAELFNSEQKTVAQLQAEIDAIDARSGLENELKKRQGPSLIQQAKNKAIEVKKAAQEVLKNDEEIPQIASENEPENTSVFEPKINEITVPETPQNEQEHQAKSEPQTGQLSDAEKLDFTVEFLSEYPDGTDEDLAEFLSLQRVAAARFWRLKAMEIVKARDTQKRTTDSLQNTPETDPKIHIVSQQKTERNRQQIRYTIAEAVKLECCKKKGITKADIEDAIKAKLLERKSDGKLSKSGVESWAKSYGKVTEKQTA